MPPSSTSPLLVFLLLIASASAKSKISFYQKASCAPGDPSAGDAFQNDNLAAGSGICYTPPSGTIAMKIDEMDEGCSSKTSIRIPLLPITIPSIAQNEIVHNALSSKTTPTRYLTRYVTASNNRKVTAYLDTTCSMPTSEPLTSTENPCYFLSPADLIGSFKAKCSDTTAASNHDQHSATNSPGLQSTPTTNAAGAGPFEALWTDTWRALIAVAVVEAACIP